MDNALDLLLKALGLIAGSAFSLYQARNLLPGARARVKADLEILRLLEPSHPLYPSVKTAVHAGLADIYATPGRTAWLRVYSWEDLVAGSILALGFGVWTAYLVTDGFSWWAVVTGFFAVGGVSEVMTGLNPKAPGRRRPQPE